MTYTQAQLAALAALIDSGDVGKLDDLPLDSTMPEGAQGQIQLAARACRRLRECLVDAISYACEGNLEQALGLMVSAEQYLGTMRERLSIADDLKGTGL